MDTSVMRKLAALAAAKEAEDRAVSYLQQQMGRFLKQKESVLLLCEKEDNAACRIWERTVQECGCVPLWLGEDHRWMTILKSAFTSKCSCIVGSPLALLSLSKLAKHMRTPLYVKNVVLAGYPTPPWLAEGVRQGLDCMVWSCFDPGPGGIISGFSCLQPDGIHLRDDIFGVDIVDEENHVLPKGEKGHVVVYLKKEPSLRFAVGATGRIETVECSCGCSAPRIISLDVVRKDQDLFALGTNLLHWSSILDLRMAKTECGLELELITFPGEKLPKLPTAAKRVIRAFNPESDAMTDYAEAWKKQQLSLQNH